MGRGRPFRPFSVDTQRRRVLALHALACLAFFVATGGLAAVVVYFGGLIALHASQRSGSESPWDMAIASHERALVRAWSTFGAPGGRRTLALEPPRPHFFVYVLTMAAVLAGLLWLGPFAEAAHGSAMAARAAAAAAAAAIVGFALFGVRARTSVVLGADGIRIGSSFVGWATVTDVVLEPGSRGFVSLERRPPHSAVRLQIPDVDTAVRVHAILDAERARARQRATLEAAPVPTTSYRESATQAGWRVRVLEAESHEERRGLLARIAEDDARRLLEETADPSLEEQLRARLGRR